MNAEKIDKSILVKDLGSYTVLLPALVRSFREVKYYCEGVSSYPRSENKMVGKGIAGVKYVENFFDEVESSDIIAFFDCHEADLQEYLRRHGKQVWGSGRGNQLELNRYESNQLLGEMELPMVDMERVIGMKALREYLKDHGTTYVKGNTRGNFETFRSDNYKLIEPQLDRLEQELGKEKDTLEFICCKPLDGDDIVEVGSDSYFIGGQYPQTLLTGYEVKDCGYIGSVKPRKEISKIIIEPLDKLSPVFEEYNYHGFFSDEIRVGKDKKPYLTDFTCRAGSPPSELFCSMLVNLGEIIDQGSQGILVEPQYSHKYGAQVIITSSFAEENWQPIWFPDQVKEFVKIKHWTVMDEVNYYVPIDGIKMQEIGSVIAMGNTIEEAIKNVKKYASQVEGYKLEFNLDALDKGIEVIESGKKLGITF